MSFFSPSDLESFPAAPPLLGRVLVLFPLLASCSFKPHFVLLCFPVVFSCCVSSVPEDRGLCSQALGTIPLHGSSQYWVGGFLCYGVFISLCSLAVLSVFGCSVAASSVLSSSGGIVLLISIMWCVPRRRGVQSLPVSPS